MKRAVKIEVKKKGKSKVKGKPFVIESEHPWAPVFRQMRSSLPRVGVREFRAGDSEFNMIRSLCQHMNVASVKGCKGVERFLLGDASHQLRHTMVLKRFDHNIVDLGC